MNAIRKKPDSFARPSAARKQRADGADARERLLHAALQLFAEKGYAKTSTREIAQLAGVNIASIKYYFGDKAGLYRAIFVEHMSCESCEDGFVLASGDLDLRQSLQIFFGGFLEPIKQGDLARHYMRLHFREVVEPTGLWTEAPDNAIKQAHAALVEMLARHMGLAKADDGVHRLAFSIAGMGVQMFVCREVIEDVRAKLIATPAAVDQWGERLVDYAEAMVAADIRQRQAHGGGKKS
ncbi:MAG TPA: CerR family C-terminal domain-containing protein [Oxalicibacterium sp.]|nr:CerR family C-terminal domain-containing protein [Oxalicibacterium sp.]